MPQSQQIRFPIDGRSSSNSKGRSETRRRHQPTTKFNQTETTKNVDPVHLVLEGDDDIAKIVRATRQVPDNTVVSQFPKIFKVDDFIIIANPKVKTPQPCTPQPVACPTVPLIRPIPPPEDDTDLRSRMPEDGDKPSKPSKCTWAILACCSPDSKNIRYTCFELLGCPGAFWDLNPCEDKVLLAASNTALQFYSGNSVAK